MLVTYTNIDAYMALIALTQKHRRGHKLSLLLQLTTSTANNKFAQYSTLFGSRQSTTLTTHITKPQTPALYHVPVDLTQRSTSTQAIYQPPMSGRKTSRLTPSPPSPPSQCTCGYADRPAAVPACSTPSQASQSYSRCTVCEGRVLD